MKAKTMYEKMSQTQDYQSKIEHKSIPQHHTTLTKLQCSLKKVLKKRQHSQLKGFLGEINQIMLTKVDSNVVIKDISDIYVVLESSKNQTNTSVISYALVVRA